VKPPKIMSCWHEPLGFSVQSAAVEQPPSMLSMHESGVVGDSQATFSRRWRMPSLQRSKPEGTGGSVKACSAGSATVSQAGAPVSSVPEVPSLPVSGSTVVTSPEVPVAVAVALSLPLVGVSVVTLTVVGFSVVGPPVVGPVVSLLALVPELLLSSPPVPLSIGPQATRPRAASKEWRRGCMARRVRCMPPRDTRRRARSSGPPRRRSRALTGTYGTRGALVRGSGLFVGGWSGPGRRDTLGGRHDVAGTFAMSRAGLAAVRVLP
jgi:hypothetical protein